MNVIFRGAFRAVHFITQPITGLILHNSRRSRLMIIVDGQILLVKSVFGKQKWSLPGGGMHKGEDQYLAAARELHEETDVSIEPGNLGLAGETRLPKNKRWPVANIHFFECRLPIKPPTKVRRPLEILEIDWFPLSRLPEDRSATVDEGLKLLY